MRPIDQLVQLQQIDSALDAVDRRLNEIRAELLDRSAIEQVEAQLTEANSVATAAESDHRDLDLETEQFRTKLKNEETKLYSGRVSSPKELTDLTHEVDQTKHLISQREDRLLELIGRVEEARSQQGAITATLNQLQDERQAREVELKQEARGLLRQQATLKQERDAARVDIAPAHLQQYDRLRVSRGGLAVAEIRQRICQGCRVALTTSEEHRLRGDALVTCSSCGRLIYGNA